MTMLEKKITMLEEQIRKDEAETERTAAQIRRAQERKRFLDGRLKENRQTLSDLQNRKAMLAIEGSIGKVDDAKLALLVKLLNDHGDEMRKEKDEVPEAGDQGERKGV